MIPERPHQHPEGGVGARLGLGESLRVPGGPPIVNTDTGRTLSVDWSDPVYSDGRRNVFPEYFRHPPILPPDSIPAGASVTPPEWNGSVGTHLKEFQQRIDPDKRRSIREWRRFRIDLSRLDHPEKIAVFWTYYEQVHCLRKHFRGEYAPYRRMKTKEILRRLAGENLELADPIRERVDRIRNGWPKKTSVGIHVRYTDKMSRIGAIFRKVDAIASREKDPILFLATDSKEAARIVARRFPNVITAEKWLPDRNRPVHLDRNCPDKSESGAAALVDLYLLAGCDHLVHDESSSFAYVASLLADTKRSKVHDVDKARWIPPRLRHILWSMAFTWKHRRRLWP